MSRKAKYSKEFKLNIVNEYMNGIGVTELIRKYECCDNDIYRWVNEYMAHGTEALQITHKNKSYSSEFKLMVVEEYLSGATSYNLLAIKHKIPSSRQIRNWVKMYNGYEGNLKAYKPIGGIIMTKGRKTSFEERIEIVEDCLKNGENYIVTAEKFKVSYNQIYSWLNKYKTQGVSALKDNRGKGKAIEDMDEIEKLQAENKLLRAKLARLEMEDDLKKKLQEVQMRLESNTRKKK